MTLLPLLMAAFAAVTVLVGLLSYWAGRQRWAHELATHARDHLRWQRALAERVWIAVEERDCPRVDEGTYRARVAVIRNDSDGPARELVLWWFLDGAAISLSEQCRRMALGPGQVWEVIEPSWMTHMGNHHEVTARLWFADMRDDHWETCHRGMVRPLRDAVAEGYASAEAPQRDI